MKRPGCEVGHGVHLLVWSSWVGGLRVVWCDAHEKGDCAMLGPQETTMNGSLGEIVASKALMKRDVADLRCTWSGAGAAVLGLLHRQVPRVRYALEDPRQRLRGDIARAVEVESLEGGPDFILATPAAAADARQSRL